MAFRIVPISTSTEVLYLDRPSAQSRVLLKVIRVLLHNKDGTLDTYTILENGSESTMLLPEVVYKLGLHKKPKDLAHRSFRNLKRCLARYSLQPDEYCASICKLAETEVVKMIDPRETSTADESCVGILSSGSCTSLQGTCGDIRGMFIPSTELDPDKGSIQFGGGLRHAEWPTLIRGGPPKIYHLQTERKVLDDNGKVRKWTYGIKDTSKRNKIVLLVGETGAGKTTLINTMVNYLLGVKFEDELWYEITEEAARDQSESQTSEITMYEVCPEESPMSLTIIDTPGYGDTRGLEKDLEVAENLSTLFQSNDGVREIDAVCFVTQASKNRLSDRQHYIISSVLSLFGKDIVNNIVFLITHSDGMEPKNVLGAINKAKIPCRRDHDDQPVYFLFNNRQADVRHSDKRYLRSQRDAWEDSMEETIKFLHSLDKKNRRSLELTSNVLIERIILEASMCNLQLRVEEKESKKTEKIQIHQAMMENKDKIEECKNFSVKLKKTVKMKVPIESASWKNRKATTCTVCEENCHEFDCWWVSDPSKCEVMKNGYCTVCTGKCHHSKHVKEDKKYVIRTIKVETKFDDIKKEYEKDEESKMFSVVMDDLDKDLQELEDQKFILLFNAYKTIKNLSQIALKPDSAFTLQHLDFFIPKLREARKKDWVRELEELRKFAEAEELNKDALNYLKAGLSNWNISLVGK